MKYYLLIIVILFIAKLLHGKQLSSCNIKWILGYIVYVFWLYEDGIVYDIEYEQDIEWILLYPFELYIIFPFIWKYIGKWSLFKTIDNFIDKWYKIIKELYK